ncbi:MAG: ribokinase [Planctomycetaceae bacterium]|nr:MAG: ribokinase [Planctomycetaceae bacterium]
MGARDGAGGAMKEQPAARDRRFGRPSSSPATGMEEVHLTRPGNILVVGSLNLDWVLRCRKIPRPGQTVHGNSLSEVPGGKGANQAVAAARQGADVRMIGRVGDDPFGAKLREDLRREGVGSDAVYATPGARSGLAVITVEDSGENAITVLAGANAQLKPADVRRAESLFKEADLVMLQLEIPLDTVLAAIELARGAARVLLDPAPAPGRFPPELLRVDILCPNETEAAALTGLPADTDEEAEVAARRLCELGAGCVLLTRGARGVTVATQVDGNVWSVPSPAVTAVDSTAAGDAFAGAFAARLMWGDDLRGAVNHAVLAGAHAVTIPGARDSLPTLADVEGLRRKAAVS